MPLNICFIHTPCHGLNDDRLEPPLGLIYIASASQAQGYKVNLVDLSSYAVDELDSRIPDGYEVYAFSTYTVNYWLTCQLADIVRRRNPQSILVAGGPHASALPNEVVADGFDFVFTGESETSFIMALESLVKGEKPPQIIVGIPPDPLDQLPFPNYDLVDLSSYSREVNNHQCVSILSSRGCPHRCTFCNSNIMGAGKPIRFRTPGNVVDEIRFIKEKYNIRHFRFQDDIFTINIKRIRELTPWLKAEEIVYRCFSRTNNFSPEMAALLKSSGCAHVSFGIETGSPKLLSKHSMNKGQTPKQIENALNNAYNAGIKSRVFLIVGFPEETDKTIEETLFLMKNCHWDEFSVYPLIAYPGTPLHDRPEDFGITYIDRNYSKYLQIGRSLQAGFTIRTKDFDELKVREWRDYVITELVADGRTWAGNSQGFK